MCFSFCVFSLTASFFGSSFFFSSTRTGARARKETTHTVSIQYLQRRICEATYVVHTVQTGRLYELYIYVFFSLLLLLSRFLCAHYTYHISSIGYMVRVLFSGVDTCSCMRFVRYIFLSPSLTRSVCFPFGIFLPILLFIIKSGI